MFYKKKLSIFAPQKGKDLFPNLANLAEIAQLVEHFIRNERVAGSSPAFGSQIEAILAQNQVKCRTLTVLYRQCPMRFSPSSDTIALQ